MKTSQSVKAVIMAVTTLCLVGTTFGSTILALNGEREYVSENRTVLQESELNIRPAVAIAKVTPGNLAIDSKTEGVENVQVAEGQSQEDKEREAEEARKNEVVYEGMTLEELASKLDRSLNSTISGQGNTFASYAIELGIYPYLAVAIVMHETGCKWECSSLLKQCNNVGGMKSGGTGKCNGGSYASFPSLEEGIRAYMNNLYKNYISQGLTTAEAMGPKYAASTTWASQVNAYINSIKAA